VGANKYAFDFALPEGGAFDVVAPADGTLVHVKMSSAKGVRRRVLRERRELRP